MAITSGPPRRKALTRAGARLYPATLATLAEQVAEAGEAPLLIGGGEVAAQAQAFAEIIARRRLPA